MKRLVSVILLAMLLCMVVAPAALANQDAIRNSVARMYVVSALTDEAGMNLVWTGSAFAVGKKGAPVRYFVTNRHVVENAGTTYIYFENSNNKLFCNVVAVSDRADLAIVALDAPTTARVPAVLRPFNIDEFSKRTEQVWVYGYPGITERVISQGTGDWMIANQAAQTVTTGTVSRTVERFMSIREVMGNEFDNYLQKDFPVGETIIHDAAVSGGHSGGPTVDKNGCVLGVNVWACNSDQSENHGDMYGSVSVNEVVRLLDAEHIPYCTAGGLSRRTVLIIALSALAAALVIAVLIILLGRKGGKNSRRRVLVCDAGALQGRTFKLKGRMTIGRTSRRCDIAFPDGTGGVSGLHCTIAYEKGVVKVCDEHSSFGTWIDGTRLEPGKPTVMHRGQRLYLGSKKQVLSLHS